MPFLAESLLNAAGFHYDRIQDIWIAPVRLAPVVTVECDEDGSYVMEALLEVHAALESAGYTYANFALNCGYLSIAGLIKAQVAAVV